MCQRDRDFVGGGEDERACAGCVVDRDDMRRERPLRMDDPREDCLTLVVRFHNREMYIKLNIIGKGNYSDAVWESWFCSTMHV